MSVRPPHHRHRQPAGAGGLRGATSSVLPPVPRATATTPLLRFRKHQRRVQEHKVRNAHRSVFSTFISAVDADWVNADLPALDPHIHEEVEIVQVEAAADPAQAEAEGQSQQQDEEAEKEKAEGNEAPEAEAAAEAEPTDPERDVVVRVLMVSGIERPQETTRSCKHILRRIDVLTSSPGEARKHIESLGGVVRGGAAMTDAELVEKLKVMLAEQADCNLSGVGRWSRLCTIHYSSPRLRTVFFVPHLWTLQEKVVRTCVRKGGRLLTKIPLGTLHEYQLDMGSTQEAIELCTAVDVFDEWLRYEFSSALADFFASCEEEASVQRAQAKAARQERAAKRAADTDIAKAIQPTKRQRTEEPAAGDAQPPAEAAEAGEEKAAGAESQAEAEAGSADANAEAKAAAKDAGGEAAMSVEEAKGEGADEAATKEEKEEKTEKPHGDGAAAAAAAAAAASPEQAGAKRSEAVETVRDQRLYDMFQFFDRTRGLKPPQRCHLPIDKLVASFLCLDRGYTFGDALKLATFHGVHDSSAPVRYSVLADRKVVAKHADES